MRHPLLFQLNTRVYLTERTRQLGRPACFDDIADTLLDQLTDEGFGWIYLLGIWQTGAAARDISRSSETVLKEAQQYLPDFTQKDIVGSAFAVQAYEPNHDLGDKAALARLRKRGHMRGMKLMLDFVPNHIAPDHHWVLSHPQFLIAGNEQDITREPRNWGHFETPGGRRVFAFGRDPYFQGWSDTVQLNYRHQGFRQAMIKQLDEVADMCDGVRCDMAMLVEPDIFLKTWGERSLPADGTEPTNSPFWPEAIARVRKRHPSFTFMAEVYWDMEWRLQQEGFDFTYDKRLYDRLHDGAATNVREHLLAEEDFQNRSARFLENHDEPRAANTFSPEMHYAAAVIAFLSPGLRFFHEGQLEGWKHHVSTHLGRRPQEPRDPEIHSFYSLLLRCLHRPEVHQGRFEMLRAQRAWAANETSNNFICFSWQDEAEHCSLVVVNYSPSQSQCYMELNLDLLPDENIRFADQFGAAPFEHTGAEVKARGLYLNLPPWGYHLFDVAPVAKQATPARKRRAEGLEVMAV